MKLSTLTLALFIHGVTYGQSLLYKQTNKILEYNYGVVDTAGMRKLSETEKIKYELRYVEKSYTKTIDQNYETVMDIVVDSNEYEKDWMHLARRFNYSSAGMNLYDKDNVFIKTLDYSQDQLDRRAELKTSIQTNGYHPGLTEFPEFNPAIITYLATQNVQVSTMANGEVKMVTPLNTTIFNKYNNTIVTEWIDSSGIKNRETKGYEPYLTNKGYLLKINKRERFVYSINGPCITETQMTFYNNYEIQDNGGLVDKAINKEASIAIYPNPNDGVFTVSATLNDNVSISSVKVINVITGNFTTVSNGGQKTFLVNLPNLSSGQYSVQLITSDQQTLNASFIKN
ncbi:MAG: T9SS type A sorting domain-containing protein [Bacteroidia bacterium]|nr:T9SS type A sorting domain-containing protein [Bacteroidia bacterium]